MQNMAKGISLTFLPTGKVNMERKVKQRSIARELQQYKSSRRLQWLDRVHSSTTQRDWQGNKCAIEGRGETSGN